jgi:hypothetical protein
MSKIDAWSTNSFPLPTWLDDHDLAVDTAQLISDKTTSIVVVRAGVAQSAQTVRIEGMGGDRQALTPAGQVYTVDAVVLGYKGHPTIADTSLRPGDRFVVAGVRYEVIMLIPGITDSVQAYAKVVA